MRPRRAALLLVLIGVLALPAPLYFGWAAQAASPPPKSPQVYAATPVEPADAEDRQQIVYTYGHDVALSLHQVSAAYSAGEYRAPDRTRAVLETAMKTGTGNTTDPDVQADLRAIHDDHRYVHGTEERRGEYYRIRLGPAAERVTLERVSLGRVANVTLEAVTVEYASLTDGERRTVDRILDRSDGESMGYRPRVDEPFADQLPALVARNGTLYSIDVAGHVDNFGPGFGAALLGLAATGVGVLLILVGLGIFGYTWIRHDPKGPNDRP
jgi:hypothetical protein